ncbi:hypothetical protein GCM10011405_09430 [Rufibacter glacialis]|nr:hypothetical protein GCM10011405_09430 [Rufibacter glacialis]
MQVTSLQAAFAQGNTLPVFEVNLTGQPNGVWDSGEIDRNGKACGATGNENCVQFNIILDKNSAGLEFSITGGPVPSGAMAYQVNCGPPVPVGQPICVSGTGPHKLTICMPGNAKNKFQIKSIAAFTPMPDISVSGGCSTTLQAPIAFEEPSITWTDITGGGIYNKYLSCTTGCATPTITPDDNPPPYVDYVVCGQSVASPCSDLPYCDTVRVYFYPPPVVSITPNPAIICPGSAGVELTGTVTGGSGNFRYLWTDKNGNLVGTNRTYLAPTTGEYSLEVRTENYPACKKFSASVTVVTNLTANAGPDQRVCASSPVPLSGSVTAALGGRWSGGAGTFSPSNTALNAVYTPTPAELKTGSVRLTLTSTGNGSCAPVSDEVEISFYNMEVTLTGPPLICVGTTVTITAAVSGAEGPVTYVWDSGETTASISNKPAGTYTVTVTDGNSCALRKSFTVTQAAGPSDLAFTLTPSTCGSANGEVLVSGVTGGTGPYTYSLNSAAFQPSGKYTALLKGTYNLQVKDANGCVYNESFTLEDVAGPSALTAVIQSSSCGNPNGSITITNVTNGTAPYAYSLNQAGFQASATFSALVAGTYSVTVKDANGCIFTEALAVENVAGPSAFAALTSSTTCGASNGSISITSVTQGTAPYVYSKDGVNFQGSPQFSGLAAGLHTITVKDAKGCTTSRQVEVTNVAGPTNLVASARASTCGNSNGELIVTDVTGGTAPFTYRLNNGAFQASASFAALAAGNHTLTVKDANGCTFSKTFSLSNTAGPSDFLTTVKSTTCGASNGELTITSTTGGTAPYTYSKDGTTYGTSATFSALAAGTYTLWVKDTNGCVFSKSFSLEDLAGPTNFSLHTTPSTCGGTNGSITVENVTGGTAPFSYSRNGTSFQGSPTFTGVTAGTYTVLIKDANGCTFSKNVMVEDVAGPSGFTITANPSTCGASNGELSITNLTGGTGPYTYSKDGSTFQTSATFTALAAGNFTLTVRDANGCTVAKQVSLSNTAGPTAVTASSQAASCANNDGRLLVGPVSGGTAPYTYSINGTTFQTSTTFAALAAGSYTVTAKDANGCLTTTQVSVAQDIPTAFASATNSSTCGFHNGSITVSSITGGTAPYTYSKDGVTFQTSATFTALAAGTYTLTVKDANGCTFSRQVPLANIAGPSDLAASLTPSTCGQPNGAVTITGVTGGTAPYTYSQDGTTFQASANFTALAAGSYTLTVKDANGCTFAKQVTLTNIAGPTAVATFLQTSSCGRANGSITVTGVTSGTAPYTYSRDGSTFQASATFAGVPAGTYTLTAKDANGCTVSRNIEVKDVAGPTAVEVRSIASTCGNSNGSLQISGVTGGTAPYTYALNSGSFQSGTTFGGVPAGEHTLTVKDANGCTFSRSVTITNVAGPANLAATTVSSTCGASNGEIRVTHVTGGTSPYLYSADGVNFQSAAAFPALKAGQHTLTVKDANGCTFAKSFTVSDIPGPSAITSTSLPASCQNNDGSIAIAEVTGGTAPYTYSLNGGAYQAQTSFMGLAAGTHTLTAKDANGCVVSAAVVVQENVPTGFASSTIASTCGRNDGQLTINQVTGGTAPYTYSKDGGTFQTSASFANLLAGTYTITVKDAKGCLFSQSVGVSNLSGPAFTVSAASTTCGASNGSIVVQGTTGGIAPYTYSKDGITFQTSPTFGNLLAGTYTLTAKDANGCLSSETVVVRDIAGPSGIAMTTAASTCGAKNGQIMMGNITGGTAPFTYSLNGGAFQTAASFSSLLAGTYAVTIKDANGCTYTERVEIKDIAGPTQLILATTASTCGHSNGSVSISGVSGGTAPFTFSLDGAAFQSAPAFAAVQAGERTLTVKDANGCTFTQKITVENVAGPSDLTAATKPSTCGNSNGELTVSAVTGGVAPYTYSRDGVNFQASTTFTAIASGSYTIFVKDANNCTFSKTVQVSDIAGPTAVRTTFTAASCQNNDGSLTITGITGGTEPYTYSLNSGAFQSTSVFGALAAGTYTVKAKDANGCEAVTTVVINANVPTAFSTSTVASTCGSSNGSISIGTVTGGTAPYTFSRDGGNFQAGTAFTGLAAGTYTITVKDAKGCTFARVITLSNLNGPTELVASTQSSTCGNSNGVLTISGVTGGTAPYLYSMDGVTFQTSATFTGLQAGAYTLTVKDANGCTYAQEASLSDVSGPSFMAVAQASTCGASNGQINVQQVTGGTGPYSYSRDGNTFQASPTFTGLLAGVYTITIRDANGCKYARSIQVTDVEGPSQLMIASTASTCGSSNGSVSVNGVTGGTAPYSFSLDGSAFQTAVTFVSVRAGEHTLTVRDANGCVFSQKLVVADVAGPSDVTAASTSSTCGAPNGGLTITQITGGTAPYTYSQDGITFQASSSFTALKAGQYAITVKDANGCTFTKTVTVQDIAGPTAVTASTLPASCLNNDGSLTITGITGGTAPYAYSINGSGFSTNTTFTALASGTHTVVVRDANGCEVTASVKIDQNVPTAFTSSTTASTCGRADGALTVSTVTGGTAPYTYSKDGQTFQPGTSFAGLAAGNHTITVKDANGCMFSAVVAVSNTAGPTFSAVATASTCGSSNGAITVNAVTGGVFPYTYSRNGQDFQASSTFQNLPAGTYTITAKDANGCLSAETVVVDDKTGPSAFQLTPIASTCGDANGQLRVQDVVGGTAPFLYSKDGVTFQSAAAFADLAAGSYTITVKDANGCQKTSTVQVGNITGPSDLQLASVTATCGAANGQISVTGVTGGQAPYSFSLNGGTFQSTALFGQMMAGEHTLTVRDANGCVTSKKVVVTNIAGPTDLVSSVRASTCGNRNGALVITGVTGGTAPYTYSKDGVNFQASSSFETLAAGSYTLVVKDANGCTFTKEVAVTDIAGPVSVATRSGVASCQDNDGSILVTGVTGGTAPFTYSLNEGAFGASTQFNGLSAGIYTVVARDANGCEATASVTVTKEVPTGLSSTSTASTCGQSNGAITLGAVSGGTAPYSYSINGTAFQSAASFSNLAAGMYTVTVQDAKGCHFSKQVQVTDVAGPSGLTTMAEATSCGDRNGKITVSAVTGGTAPYTYQLNSSAFQTEATFASLAAGTFTLTVKDANGCTFSQEAVVGGSSAPGDFRVTVQPSTCGEANGTVTVADVIGGVHPYSYSKDGIVFQASATLADLRAGRYNIVVKDAMGCTFTKSVEVGNTAGPQEFTLTSTASTCGQRNGTILLSNVAGGTAPYQYKLEGGTWQASATFGAVAAGTYTVTVQDANGCTLAKQVTVTDQAAMTALGSSTTPATCGNNGAIAIQSTTGGTAPYMYSLDGITFQAATTFTGLAPKEYQIQVKDANNCLATFTVQVGENRLKTAEITSAPAACGQNNGSITVASVTGGIKPLAYSLNGTSFQASPVFGNLATGTYTITIRDAEGCVMTKSQEVKSSGGPESFTLTSTLASCGNANGKISIGGVTGGQSPYTYSINGTSFQNTPEFSGLAEGTYQISVKDATGCVQVKATKVESSLPITHLTFSVTPAGCGQTTGQVTVTQVTGGTAPYSYSLNGGAFSGAATLLGVAPGNHVLSVKDAQNCTFSLPVTVPAVESKVTLVTHVLCAGGKEGVITLSATGADNQTEFSIDNGRTFQKSPEFRNLPAGSYQVVTRFSASCELALGTVEIKEPIPLQASVKPLTPTSVVVTGLSGGTAPYTFQLDNGKVTSDSVFTGLAEGTHTLLVQDKNGCRTQVTFTAGETGGIEIPTGFTPNGDGINDHWILKNVAVLYPNCKVTVYNRWGSPVFESRGYKQAWDGTHKGKDLPVGTYYTVIELGNGQAPIRKSLTIMR